MNELIDWLTELTTTLELHYQMREILLNMPLQSYHLDIADGESFAAR